MELSRDQLADMYYRMWLIRIFDQNARKMFEQDRIRGTTHTYIGEEAVAVGTCAALREDDFITSTHRGHGHCLAKGGDPKAMMGELLGKATGYCKGKGGSMHIADLDLGILGANGIVGGGIGIATGAAYSADLRGSDQVSVCFFGDGASNQGILFETTNMAVLWNLPIIYLCEENQYAEFSQCKPFIAVDNLELKAAASGMHSLTVDGNDVLAVYQAMSEATKRARQGGGPTFLVARTYRIEGHTVGDPLNYRPEGETESWKSPDRDPIHRFAGYLTGEAGFPQEELAALEQQARDGIQAAVDFAIDSPDPEVATLWEDVYA